jgi:hypothetical protein
LPNRTTVSSRDVVEHPRSGAERPGRHRRDPGHLGVGVGDGAVVAIDARPWQVAHVAEADLRLGYVRDCDQPGQARQRRRLLAGVMTASSRVGACTSIASSRARRKCFRSCTLCAHLLRRRTARHSRHASGF